MALQENPACDGSVLQDEDLQGDRAYAADHPSSGEC